ncbi:RidA family protein [Candidatus Ichthyocystis hellenicum]|uniref:RidA family protein n=1 Tax=Candidatus Ichthyocystis hellenicum TaxID=1561003 RepID=UPI000AA4E351|nr:Rid family detoxifying hydrolase [Candidatus Ichthyocystis hellenicum]
MLNVIETDQAPNAIGPYSQGRIVDNLVYTSGQIGLDPKSMKIRETFDEQVDAIFKNLDAILKAGNSDLSKIVKLTIYLVDMKNYASLNEFMTKVLPKPYPARTTIVVSQLPLNALVEIEAVATKK